MLFKGNKSTRKNTKKKNILFFKVKKLQNQVHKAKFHNLHSLWENYMHKKRIHKKEGCGSIVVIICTKERIHKRKACESVRLVFTCLVFIHPISNPINAYENKSNLKVTTPTFICLDSTLPIPNPLKFMKTIQTQNSYKTSQCLLRD